jgi:hypothetical protein
MLPDRWQERVAFLSPRSTLNRLLFKRTFTPPAADREETASCN